jgi:5'-methylthioinosine phosphorylase
MNKIGIIGGTGLTEIAELQVKERLEVSTDYGDPSSSLVCGEISGVEVFFIARHGEDHTIPPHCVNYRANISALSSVGVSHIIAVNAVGGIRADLGSGTIAIPHQIIDYTYGREHTFSSSATVPLAHVDFTHPYDKAVRSALVNGLRLQNVSFSDSAVYAATQGPRLESIAEINRLEQDGCDLVGMTGMPEASLAREAGIAYGAIALIVNTAAGRRSELIDMDEIYKVIEDGMPKIKAAVVNACLQLKYLC